MHLLGLNSNKSVSIAKWGRPELSNKNEIHCLRLKIWPDLNAVKITFVSEIKSPSSDKIDVIAFNRKVWISEQPILSSFSAVLHTRPFIHTDFFYINTPF